jgi:hypothetical protein
MAEHTVQYRTHLAYLFPLFYLLTPYCSAYVREYGHLSRRPVHSHFSFFHFLNKVFNFISIVATSSSLRHLCSDSNTSSPLHRMCLRDTYPACISGVRIQHTLPLYSAPVPGILPPHNTLLTCDCWMKKNRKKEIRYR